MVFSFVINIWKLARIYVGVDAIDMRKGFNGLYGLVRDRLGQDPLSGHLFRFTNPSRTRIKALVWEGSRFLNVRQEARERPLQVAFDATRQQRHYAAGGTGNAD